MATVDYATIALYGLLAFSFLSVARKATKAAYRAGLAIGAVGTVLALIWELADEGLVSLPASVTEVLFWVTLPAFLVGAIAGLVHLVDNGSELDA